MSTCLSKYFRFKIVTFDPESDRISKVLRGGAVSNSARQRLAYPHNFLRFYLNEYFPQIQKAIYLDSDILVTNGDLTILYDTVLVDDFEIENQKEIIAVAKRYFLKFYKIV